MENEAKEMDGSARIEAWRKWLGSEDGIKTRSGVAEGPYLENRLWYAFLAGIEAAQESQRKDGR